ncbi:MAG: AtpZ/AtpI family protein [Thermodesulfobacteriota bacterium]
MADPNAPEEMPPPPEEDFSKAVERQESRKLKARSRDGRGVWFGLGVFGLIGWSVALPALAGVALGAWIDRTWPSRYSWTLMLLLGGIILGSLNAWHWVTQERKKIEKDE